MDWKIKRQSNDELRQKFIDQTVPQADAIGLRIPDDDLTLDEATGHYQIGPIDWDEFTRVVSGNGPCNRERLENHQRAHDEGAWVREAMQAYSQRKQGDA